MLEYLPAAPAAQEVGSLKGWFLFRVVDQLLWLSVDMFSGDQRSASPSLMLESDYNSAMPCICCDTGTVVPISDSQF